MLNKLKKVMKWILISYLSLASLVWLASPFVANPIIQSTLDDFALTLGSETSIYYNPFIHRLTIEDFALYKKEQTEPAFAIKSLIAEIRLHQFLFDTLYISEFAIDGLTLDIDINEQGNTIAGITLPLEQTDNNIDNEKVSEELPLNGEENAEPLPYQVVLPNFNLTDSQIDIQYAEQKHSVKLNKLMLSELFASITNQKLTLMIDSQVNNAPLVINALLELNNQQGQIDVDLTLNKLDLSHFQGFLPDPNDKLAGELSLSFNSAIKLAAQQQVSVTVNNHLLLLENLTLAYQDYILSLAQQKVEAELTQIDMLSPDNITVTSDASYFIEQLQVSIGEEPQTLLSFDSLTIPNIKVSNELDVANYKITLADLNLVSLVFSDNLADDILPLASLSSLKIDAVELDQQGAAIGPIQISDLAIQAELDEQKQLVNLIPLPEDETINETPVVEEEIIVEQEKNSEKYQVQAEPMPTSVFDFSLASFVLTNPATINFKDRSITPNYQHNFVINTLTVGKLDSKQPDLTTEIVLKGNSNEYENFDFTSHISPFKKEPSYQLTGYFKEVNLPDVSSYIKDALQFEIDSGHFDLALDVNITGTELSGDANVLLRKIEFKVLEHEEEQVTKTSVPFNVALGMLKDGDGNVELNLPLTGDISDPSFGFSGLLTLLVKQATMSAAKDYLITTFVPYAQVVKIAMSAGEFALKVRVEDLVYRATETALQPEQQVFLDQFAALLKDKADLEFKLCPISTPEDIGLPLGKAIDNQELSEKLHNLSMVRVKTFKNYMIDKHNIASARLLICKARIDTSKDAKPRITFAI